ncbi:MAG: SRPBCC domain-containing protein [Bacteroidetes bacterium]|nr:SRPBCC domain-containing protein [Bacteroidota bacterium]
MSYDIHLEFIVPAKPEVVMQLLTDEKLLRRWSGGEAKVEKRGGGNFEMFDGWVYGKVLKITDKELAYTWKTTDWAEDVAASEVHYKLEKDKEGTKVILNHTGLPNEEEMNEHKEGWDDQFFGLMEEYIYSMKL